MVIANHINAFESLLAAFEEDDEELVLEIYKSLQDNQVSLSIETNASVDWLESEYENYSGVPEVTQTCKLLINGEVVREWDRVYGVELSDVSHTGLCGEWTEIRLDAYEEQHLEDLIEDVFEIDIPLPDIPEPIPVEDECAEDEES